jgi:membrane protease YdiL (CAAX protease family)
MRRVFKHLGVFLLWNLVAGFFLLFLEPLVAIPIALALYGALLWGYLLRPSRGESRLRRWATLRLRPLTGAHLHWSLAAVPVVLLLSWALGDVYTRVVPVPAESLNPFEDLLSTPAGRLMISVFAIGVAPVVEEFIFRGLIQRELERRHGAAVGIAGGAALFALVHLLPWIFPLHFFLGAAFGFVVWATRSIWTGVILHTANNAAAMVGLALTGEEPAPTGTLWEIGLTADLWMSVATLVVTAAGAAWMAGKFLQLRKLGTLPGTSRPAYLR